MSIQNFSENAFNVYKTLVDQYDVSSKEKTESALISSSSIKKWFSEFKELSSNWPSRDFKILRSLDPDSEVLIKKKLYNLFLSQKKFKHLINQNEKNNLFDFHGERFEHRVDIERLINIASKSVKNALLTQYDSSFESRLSEAKREAHKHEMNEPKLFEDVQLIIDDLKKVANSYNYRLHQSDDKLFKKAARAQDALFEIEKNLEFEAENADFNEKDIKTLINNMGALVTTIASCYLNQNLVEDIKKGVEYLEYAADHGMIEAQQTLIDYYRDDKFGLKNDEKRFKYSKLGADQNDYKSIWNLGLCYELGLGVEKNAEKAIECYQKLIGKKGIEELQKLANSTGIEYLKYAADNGTLKAQQLLIDHYRHNRFGPEDSEQVIKYLILAANQNDYDALFHLGLCYESGIGVEKNFIEAFKCYEKLAKDRQIKGLYKLAKDRQIKGLYKLAECYELGKGVAKNLKKAIKYLEKCSHNSDNTKKISFDSKEALEAKFKLAVYLENYSIDQLYEIEEASEEDKEDLDDEIKCLYLESENGITEERKDELKSAVMDVIANSVEFK